MEWIMISLDLREMMCRYAWTTGVGIMRRCHEIVMVVRSKRIISKQKGSNRLMCNPLRNIVR